MPEFTSRKAPDRWSETTQVAGLTCWAESSLCRCSSPRRAVCIPSKGGSLLIVPSSNQHIWRFKHAPRLVLCYLNKQRLNQLLYSAWQMLSDASELCSRPRGEILAVICQSMPFLLLKCGCMVQPSPRGHGLMSRWSTWGPSYCPPELLLPVSGATPVPIIATCIPVCLYHPVYSFQRLVYPDDCWSLT